MLYLKFYYYISHSVFHLLGDLAAVGDDCWYPWLYLQRLGRLKTSISLSLYVIVSTAIVYNETVLRIEYYSTKFSCYYDNVASFFNHTQ